MVARMGILDWLLGRKPETTTTSTERPREAALPRVRAETRLERTPRPDFSPQPPREDRWYVPAGGDVDRFVAEPGQMPPLHVIPYTTSAGEDVLTLCEDSTGLLVGPRDRRLQRAGIFSIAAGRGR